MPLVGVWCPPGAGLLASVGPMWNYTYFEASATSPIRHDFVWSEEERREGSGWNIA